MGYYNYKCSKNAEAQQKKLQKLGECLDYSLPFNLAIIELQGYFISLHKKLKSDSRKAILAYKI
jgi:hypothetical protein